MTSTVKLTHAQSEVLALLSGEPQTVNSVINVRYQDSRARDRATHANRRAATRRALDALATLGLATGHNGAYRLAQATTPDHTDAATAQPSDYSGVTTADLAEILAVLDAAPATLQVMAVFVRVKGELARRDAQERSAASLAVMGRAVDRATRAG